MSAFTPKGRGCRSAGSIKPTLAITRLRRRCVTPVRCFLHQKDVNLANSDWHNLSVKHVVESQQFSQESLDLIFRVAREMESVRPGTEASRQLDGYVMSTLFYEPSTRTRLSFESAMSRLGGSVLSTENAREFSSVAKGETLEGIPIVAFQTDLISTLQCLGVSSRCITAEVLAVTSAFA